MTIEIPPAHSIDFSSIPGSLKSLPRWICWRWEQKADSWSKMPKRPLQPNVNASSTDETTWTDYETAKQSAEANSSGLGFVFNGDGIVGVDLDDCREPQTGKLAGWSQDIVDKLGTYCEVSPSGTGVKLFVRGDLGETRGGKFPHPDGDGCVEIYKTGRYFAVTGQRVDGTSADVRERQAELIAVHGMAKAWLPQRPERPVDRQPVERVANGDRDRQYERARAWLLKRPGAVSGQDGHNHTFKTALAVVGFGLNCDDAFELISEWNLKCEPLWSDAELEHKIDSAIKANPAPMADRPIEQPDTSNIDGCDWLKSGEANVTGDSTFQAASKPSCTVQSDSSAEAETLSLETALEKILANAKLQLDNGDAKGAFAILKNRIGMVDKVVDVQPFATMSSAELDAADLRTEYLVDGILAAKQPCIIAASKKSLKTTISIDLTLSLASGSKFLNQFYVPRPVRVALMSGESGDATIQETARRIAKSKPWWDLGKYENAIWGFQLPRLGRPETKATLQKFIEDHHLEVMIIDPAYLCLDLGDDAGNLFSVGKKLVELTEIIQETGCTICIVHHCKKSTADPFAVPELESIAWSGFQEWARQWILLNRREAYNPDQAGSHRLWLSVGGSAGHSGTWGLDVEEGSLKDVGGRKWEVELQGFGQVVSGNIEASNAEKEERKQAKEEKKISDAAAKLLRQYEKLPTGDTARSYRERAGLNGVIGNLAQSRLLEMGAIEPCTVTKNSRSYDGFRFVASTTGSSGSERVSTGSCPASPSDGHTVGLFSLIENRPSPTHCDTKKRVNETRVSEDRELSHREIEQVSKLMGS